MRRLSPSSSGGVLCSRCIRRQPTESKVPLSRQSAFLAHHRPQQPPPSTDVTTKRNLSQLAGPVDFYAGPNFNALMHSQPPTGTFTPAFPGITSDVLDKMFERSPLWQKKEDQQLVSPVLNTGDPEGIQKYLLQGSPIPKNTVDLLTVLDALIAQDNLARAAMVVASLKRQLEPGTPLSTLVYNKYLEGVISSSIQKNAGIGRAMDWFQEMENNGVNGDRTTFALLSKAAFALTSVSDGNRAARKVFGLWRSQGGDIGDLLCDLMFPPEELLRSLKLNKMSLDDISDGYRLVLDGIVKTNKQTQTILPDQKPSGASAIPAVRATISKSPHLVFMKKSLETLYSDSERPEAMDKVSDALDGVEPAELFSNTYDMAQQRALEEGAYTSALEVWKFELAESLKRGEVIPGRLGIRGLAWDWVQAMKPVLEQQIINVCPPDVNQYGQEMRISLDKDTESARLDKVWLSALPVETLCAITITEVIRHQVSEARSNGCKATTLIANVGRAVEKEMQAADLVRKENKGLHPKNINLRQLMTRKRTAERYAAKFHKEVVQGTLGGTSYWPYEWRADVRIRGAAVLVASLLEATTVEMSHQEANGKRHSQIAPAFYYTYAYVQGKKVGMIKPNRFLAERLSSNPTLSYGMQTKQAPMLVQPRQWSSWDEGGYWYTREEVMRTRASYEQKAYLKEASDSNQMDEVFRGLDILGETCWTINRKIFDTILTVWNSGEAIADIPPLASGMQYPAEPKSMKWDVKARINWIQQCKQVSRLMQNAHSQRCDLNYKLEIARAFLGKRMYFPHNLDFRGRAYPVPPHFNHLGNDLCRGLLLFHEGKPLGERGLRWLKIHLANVYGLDKMRLEEREEFATNSLEQIFDSADNPLEGSRWWLNADDPWQCLATCFELTAALRSQNPTAYVCRLPLHQDGSCNGLQHYAALGGDLEGAKQVNLEPADRPQDVYSGVAQLVAADIEKQAQEGNEVAITLRGHITRKIVKQTVMTNVYGVTFIGAKAQIYRALKDKGDIDPAIMGYSADLIARSTFKCLKDMFTGAHEIQEWLKQCAKSISKSLGPKDFIEKKPKSGLPYLSTVVWTSPLGLPICQPYRKGDTKMIHTLMSNIYLSNPNSIGPVNSRKQATAFPPNFIHSLDASHMLMSATACDKAGLTFASVHDSFWTHACDVDTMNVILREAFIRMHQGGLIKRLRDEFLERYQGHYYLVDTADKTYEEIVNVDTSDIDPQTMSEEQIFEKVAKRSGREWKPLKFPPIPKKGEFDVSRLKESIYFFS